MRCNEFRKLLKAFLAEELSEKDRQPCETHLTSCEACLDVWLSQQQEAQNQNQAVGRLSESASHALTASIMQNTELDPCQASENLLCDLVDESLDLERKQLLTLHLESCRDCKKLAATLEALSGELALLAEVEPAPELFGNILQRTIPGPDRVPERQSAAKRWFVRFPQINFQRLMQRPRFSLEASFSTTLLWIALFGAPTGLFSAAAAEQLVGVDLVQLQQRLTDAQHNLDEGFSNIPTVYFGVYTKSMDALSNLGSSIFYSGLDTIQQGGNQALETAQTWFTNLRVELGPDGTVD